MSTVEPTTEVIIVHGLWFGAWAMKRLERSLQIQATFGDAVCIRRFSYRSTQGSLDQHAEKLQAFVRQSTDAANPGTRHYVAHSMGGLVILRMFSLYSNQAPGRIVLLGSPLRGSSVARKVARIPGIRRLLGEARYALESGYRELPAEHEVGMVAGTRRVGLGLLIGEFRTPGDGTVALAETHADGLSAHTQLPLSHTGLVFSGKAAKRAGQFLQSGAFDEDEP